MLRMKRFGKDKITQKKSHIEHPAKPWYPRPLAPAPRLSRFLQKKLQKARAPALRFHKKALRSNPMLSNSGKSPSRSTGKANIQIVARASANR